VTNILDLDRKPLELVESAYNLSKEYQLVRNNQCLRDYKLYQGFIDESDRDPDRANIFIPKIYSIVETKVPRDVKALIGSRPYIPFEAEKPEHRDASRVMVRVVDKYLDMGNFYAKFVSAAKMKTLYGTSFMEALPFVDLVNEKSIEPVMLPGIPYPVGEKIVENQVQRLRFRLKEFAPWEIYVDPFATSLEHKGECAYVIKVMLVRKEQILEMAQMGAYPGIDIEAFISNERGSETTADHWGLQMLSELGLTQPSQESGVGILLRFESDKRYIDIWNGQTVLRDIANPFKHGMINLSRLIHNVDAHSQNSFWGIGEAKPAEILQLMLNDNWNMTFDNHNMMNQGMTYYRDGSLNPDSLVRTVGNKIPVDSDSDRPIRDLILESFGQPLPQDHYQIPQIIERMIDLESGVFELQRGEQSDSDRTATESAMRKEYGDSRQELNVRMCEMLFMKSFGEKMLHLIDQFATMADIVEIVGEKDAQLIYGLNPADLPGGYNFTFKGADKVSNMLMKQRNWKELLPLMLQIPNVMPGKLAVKMLEIFEEDEPTTREMVIPDETMIQIQEQQREQEALNIEIQEARDHKRQLELAKLNASQKEQGNKFKDNNRKSTGKGAIHSKKQPNHDNKSEAQHQARKIRGQ